MSEQMGEDHRCCDWCEAEMIPNTTPNRKRFCTTACRNAYHSALRQWAQRAVEHGEVME